MTCPALKRIIVFVGAMRGLWRQLKYLIVLEERKWKSGKWDDR